MGEREDHGAHLIAAPEPAHQVRGLVPEEDRPQHLERRIGRTLDSLLDHVEFRRFTENTITDRQKVEATAKQKEPDKPRPRQTAAGPLASAVAAQLCAVLSAVHAVPIVHRDPRGAEATSTARYTIDEFGIKYGLQRAIDAAAELERDVRPRHLLIEKRGEAALIDRRRQRLGALGIVLAADTLSIATMEVVDNAVMAAIPGALDAGLDNPVFWIAMMIALTAAGIVAYPVNRYLLGRGKGHALTHGYHGGAEPTGWRRFVPSWGTGALVAVIVAFMLGGLVVAATSGLDTGGHALTTVVAGSGA